MNTLKIKILKGLNSYLNRKLKQIVLDEEKRSQEELRKLYPLNFRLMDRIDEIRANIRNTPIRW